MTQNRDYGAEIDSLRAGLEELQRMVRQLAGSRMFPADPVSASPEPRACQPVPDSAPAHASAEERSGSGTIWYTGLFAGARERFRWEPRERRTERLLAADADKAAKVLAAIGHKQRLDILKSVLQEPLTGAELVERLHMGTTGQLYHHLKALQSADLLVQEDRGGTYSVPPGRMFPLLLLLASAAEMLDTSDYLDMAEARSNASAYVGSGEELDPHYLLRAVAENAILEHQAGYCTEIGLALNGDGSVTVADNGRGIPVRPLPETEKSQVQAVLTDMKKLAGTAYTAPGSGKGISIAVVNALSGKLYVEVRRDGKIFRQDYRRGIPQTDLLTVGLTRETGTSITFLPDPELFRTGFDPDTVAKYAEETARVYPNLKVQVLEG